MSAGAKFILYILVACIESLGVGAIIVSELLVVIESFSNKLMQAIFTSIMVIVLVLFFGCFVGTVARSQYMSLYNVNININQDMSYSIIEEDILGNKE